MTTPPLQSTILLLSKISAEADAEDHGEPSVLTAIHLHSPKSGVHAPGQKNEKEATKKPYTVRTEVSATQHTQHKTRVRGPATAQLCSAEIGVKAGV
jgi:hypothetical protein